MKVGQNFFPKSSFLSVDKDLSIIINKILSNDRLCKLLYYTEKDCLKAENLTMAQKLSMINKQIKIVPWIFIDKECPNYIIVSMTDFMPNDTNPEFRDCAIEIKVLCHPDHWNLGDFALRPYKIMGEIDAMLNGQKLTGIGEVTLRICSGLNMNGELCGLSATYDAVHGVEDQIKPLS